MKKPSILQRAPYFFNDYKTMNLIAFIQIKGELFLLLKFSQKIYK
jgi:hypothetical protein